MFKKILVPLDGSTLAERALATAADVAVRARASLVLAHADTLENYIYEEGMPVLGADGLPLRGTHEQAYLRRMAAAVQQQWPVPVETRLLEAHHATAAQTLATCVETEGADLVVMTAHGHSGLERLWLGSVADQLIRSSVAPVLLLHGAPDASVLPTAHRMLVPLDGAPQASRVLPTALALAELLGVELALMQVVPVLDRAATVVGTPAQDSGFDTQLNRAESYLGEMAKSVAVPGARVTTHVAMSGHVAASILEAARTVPGTLIAMTTYVQDGVQRMFLGSVADKIIRAYDGPVLVMRP